uniref:Uncharacterized protein n=1 Tax=Anguilla anguilla TaxID=7936 RepID=A0A0E9VTV3_ANGAN
MQASHMPRPSFLKMGSPAKSNDILRHQPDHL